MTVNASKDWIQQLYVREFGPKLQPNDFYYNSEGKMVMTEEYHKRRGSCCGSGCKHCPYEPKHLKGTKELLQKSWNYANDSYKTDIPIHYPPYVIACSVIFLAARNFKLPLPKMSWWEIYETKIEEIQEICSELLYMNDAHYANVNLKEISEILYNHSYLRESFELQEKEKKDIIEKEIENNKKRKIFMLKKKELDMIIEKIEVQEVPVVVLKEKEQKGINLKIGRRWKREGNLIHLIEN